SVPLLGRGQHVVGVINVHARKPRRYGEHDVALLTRVGNLMARTIENARLYERLAEREQTLERFAARTVDAQELERRRLAGEIHDGISQRLISLWYHLQAAAEPVTIRLSATGGTVHLVVEDDGRGFRPVHSTRNRNGEPSYGLVGMRERAELVGARLQVTSAVGSGTRVQVDLPAPRSRQ